MGSKLDIYENEELKKNITDMQMEVANLKSEVSALRSALKSALSLGANQHFKGSWWDPDNNEESAVITKPILKEDKGSIKIHMQEGKHIMTRKDIILEKSEVQQMIANAISQSLSNISAELD